MFFFRNQSCAVEDSLARTYQAARILYAEDVNTIVFFDFVEGLGGGADSPAMQSLMRPNFFPPQQDQQWKSCSLIGRGITKSEGPRTLPENRSLISLSTDESNSQSVWEGKVMVSEPVAVNMAVSTLYLHDLIHRRNQPQRLNANIRPMTMPGIRESPDEEDQNHDENAAAAAALVAAVDNLSVRMAKSN